MAAMLLPSALPCVPSSPRASTPSRRATPRENIIQTCRSLQQILSLSPSRANLPLTLPRTPSKSRFSRGASVTNSRPQTPRTPPAHHSGLRRSTQVPKTPSTRMSSTRMALRTPVKTPPPRGINKRRREVDDVGGKQIFGHNIFDREFRFTQENPTSSLFAPGPSLSSSTAAELSAPPGLEENPFVTPKRCRISAPEPAIPVRNLRQRRIIRKRPLFVPRRRVQEEWECGYERDLAGRDNDLAELVTMRLTIDEERSSSS